MISTIPSDSSHLIAYVMTHNKMNQLQAMKWLDKRVPNWRTEEPKMPNLVESKSSADFDDENLIEWVRCESVTEVFHTGGDNVKLLKPLKTRAKDK